MKVMATSVAEAMPVAVTRCLSPLGTGNDETGSAGCSGAVDFRTSMWSSLTVPSLVGKSVCVGSSTAFDVDINIAGQESFRKVFDPPIDVDSGQAT
jgi:hypothetical protein